MSSDPTYVTEHRVVNTEHLTIDETTGEVTAVDHIGLVCTFPGDIFEAMCQEYLGDDDQDAISFDAATIYHGMVDAAKLIGGAIILHPVVENLANILWMLVRGQ